MMIRRALRIAFLLSPALLFWTVALFAFQVPVSLGEENRRKIERLEVRIESVEGWMSRLENRLAWFEKVLYGFIAANGLCITVVMGREVKQYREKRNGA